MPSECKFTLNKENAVYMAGKDKIEGTVSLTTENDKKVGEIQIHFKGFIRCGFQEVVTPAEGQPSSSASDTYFTSKEKLVKIEQTVHGPGVLQAGNYTWHFSFVVPEECPTSIEGRSGHIRYQLTLKIYNEDKYNNLFVKPLTVIKTDDLNLRPDCKKPLTKKVNAAYCCGLAKNLGAHFNLSTDFGGYVPGQWLKYDIQVLNKAPGTEYTYDIKFIRETKYMARKPDKKDIREETIIYEHKITSNSQVEERIESAFFLPATPPTIVTQYLSVRYWLRAALKSPCCSRILLDELEIPIGTIPIMESLLPQQQQQLVEVRGNQYIISVPYFVKPIPNTTFKDKTADKINRVDNFMPTYTNFRYIDSRYLS